MVKLLQSLKRVRISLNDLKTVISISVTKYIADVLQLWKRTNWKDGKKNIENDGKYFD